MKYRSLSVEELEPLKDDFISFLIMHGIDGEKWIKLKNDEAIVAQQYIDRFSDFVFEKICSKVEFLVMRESGFNYYMHIKNDSLTTLRTSMMKDNHEIALKEVKHKADERNQIIFGLLEKGALISDGKAYKSASLLWAEKSLNT